MTTKKLKLLDCTLRDGGYYNKWDFDYDDVMTYLHAVADAEIDYVELGLRQFEKKGFLGAHAYTTKEFLSSLSLPSGPSYGVMVDAKTILARSASQEVAVKSLFLESRDECISFVRIAAHFNEVENCYPMLRCLKELGYTVGLNIMQASLRTHAELTALSKLISSWGVVDVVYFADSLGSMSAEDVENIFNGLRSNWSGELGFHSHNNMGKAISNVHKAISCGCTWIDSTITGMGRGAGNAETEYLLLEPEFEKPGASVSGVLALSVNRFEPLKKKEGWGVSVPYYLGALKGVHPTYVQELCADSSVNSELIPGILSDISETQSPHVFSSALLDKAKYKTLSSSSKDVDNTTPEASVSRFADNREVVLIAQTDSTKKYERAISLYVEKKQAIAISINLPTIAQDIDYAYIAITHNEKFREQEEIYSASNVPFIAPKYLFADLDINILHDYGFVVAENDFQRFGSHCSIPARLTVAYAIACCLDAGASKISLAGFSGFDHSDRRQKEMESFLSVLSKFEINISTITPSKFSLPEGSVYAL